MTGFLGQLGIDWHLLLAQVVNFAILFWLLTKLIYRPLLKSLENSDLVQADKEMAAVRQAQAEMKKVHEQAEAAIREKTAAMLAEAERVAEDVKKKAQAEAEEMKRHLLEQAKVQMAAQEGAAVTAGIHDRFHEVDVKLVQTWHERLGEELGPKVQATYFTDLLKQIAELPAADLQRLEPEVTVASAWPLTADEAEKIRLAVAEKYGRQDMAIGPAVTDAALVAGYRVTADGYAIESNLSSDIRHAING
ncbi:MAG: F0F1 ATP synthase subunit delta [Patescibacteria group bacterium]|nr:F0F1 ATP synthase subunit delta [Patescibacteria group bacterium]